MLEMKVRFWLIGLRSRGWEKGQEKDRNFTGFQKNTTREHVTVQFFIVVVDTRNYTSDNCIELNTGIYSVCKYS